VFKWENAIQNSHSEIESHGIFFFVSGWVFAASHLALFLAEVLCPVPLICKKFQLIQMCGNSSGYYSY
jgi:hypothetical protein